MTIKNCCGLLLLGVLLLSATHVGSTDLTPSENLTGISTVHEKISIRLRLEGAEEFQIDPEEVKKIIRGALSSANIATNGAGFGVPMVGALIVGESTGGGGARYTVEMYVRATILSPFAQNRSVDVIFWRDSTSGEERIRYDPAAKGLVKPSLPINERVYASLREVASRLATEFRKANASS